jgi:DNA repair exonuclease SbcCD nuclease subunit
MSSTTYRFVHASDLHLDVPFQGIGRTTPAITHAMGQAALATWDALVQLTIDQNAAFLLLSGDICDGSERAIPAQVRFVAGLQRLSSHGIRTFIIRGNQDPAERWMGMHQWPEGVRCFGARDVESVSVTTVGGHMATIHGLSHSTERIGNRVSRFRRGQEPGIHVGMLHASVGASDATLWDHCSMKDLQSAGMDYWALGHDHRHQRLSQGDPWIVYPGTLQGRSLEADETGPKGAVVVTVADNRVTDATPYPLDAVRLVRAKVDISTFVEPSDLRRALFAAAARLKNECAGRTVIVTCEVVGQAQRWLGAQPVDSLWDRLLEELRQEHSGDAFVWWDSLLDMTDSRESRNQDDVSVYVHRLVEVMRRAPSGIDRILADESLSPSTLESVEIDDLLTSAERAALSLLEREQL